jgi:hypothetical protein
MPEQHSKRSRGGRARARGLLAAGAGLAATLALCGCASGPEAQRAAPAATGAPATEVAARASRQPAAVSAEQLLALAQGCANVVSKHLYALDDGSKVPICGLQGAVYWTADMDVDCDGKPTPGKCGKDKSLDCCYQDDTAVHNAKDEPLTSAVTPYVVIPGDFKYPGLHKGAVVAVIYNKRVQYAIFGDTGPKDIIGEASYSCAEKLGIPPSALDGGVQGQVVTYIVFTGEGTVPKDIEDQVETALLGQSLAARLLAENKGVAEK